MQRLGFRVLKLVALSVLLLLASLCALLWYKGNDLLSGLARRELATAGVILDNLDWHLEPNSLVIDNISLAIRDSKISLYQLRLGFDKSWQQQAFVSVTEAFDGLFKLPYPSSIALGSGEVLLGPASLAAAQSQQTDDETAMALDLSHLPLIAFGPIKISTQAGPLVTLAHLSLGNDRQLLGQLTLPQGQNIVDLQGKLSPETWHAKITLSLNPATELIKQLADMTTPLNAANPLLAFLQQYHQLDADWQPSLSGNIEATADIALQSAKLTATLFFREVSISVGRLQNSVITLAESRLDIAASDSNKRLTLFPTRVSTSLDRQQRLAMARRQWASSHENPSPLQSALRRLDEALPHSQPLSITLALPDAISLPLGSAVETERLLTTHLNLDASANPWRLAVEAKPSWNMATTEWYLPLKASLTHKGELALSDFWSTLEPEYQAPDKRPSIQSLAGNVAKLALTDATMTITGAASGVQQSPLALAISTARMEAAYLLATPAIALGQQTDGATGENLASLAAEAVSVDATGEIKLLLDKKEMLLNSAHLAVKAQSIKGSQRGAMDNSLAEVGQLDLASTFKAPNVIDVSGNISLLQSLTHSRLGIYSELSLTGIRLRRQLPRADGSKRMKTQALALDSLDVSQQLNSSKSGITSTEQWQLGRHQPLIFSSQQQLKLDPIGKPKLLDSSWQGNNSLGDWREALASAINLSSETPLAGNTAADANIRLDFSAKTTDIRLNAKLYELEGNLGQSPFHGGALKGNCSLYQHRRTSDNWHLDCRRIDWQLDYFQPGIIVTNIKGDTSLTLAADKQGELSDLQLKLSSVGDLLEGKFLIPDFSLDLNGASHAYLILSGLSLEKLLELQPVQGIRANGIFDGVLPIEMQDAKVSVSGGHLAARAPGGLIQVQDNPAVNELVATQPHLTLVFDALKHLDYSSLAGTFDMAKNGDAEIKVEVKGKSEGIERPIHLNYSHQENMLQLIRSLTVGQMLQHKIEHSIN